MRVKILILKDGFEVRSKESSLNHSENHRELTKWYSSGLLTYINIRGICG
jgi:hypothetical protein